MTTKKLPNKDEIRADLLAGRGSHVRLENPVRHIYLFRGGSGKNWSIKTSRFIGRKKHVAQLVLSDDAMSALVSMWMDWLN